MITVIYTENLEPITVLDLPVSFLNSLAEKGTATVRVRADKWRDGVDYKDAVLRHRTITAWDGEKVSLVTSQDEEAIMFAMPSWLPGQRGQVNQLWFRIKNLLGQRLG